jgi:phosphoribosylamine--glycine ligase
VAVFHAGTARTADGSLAAAGGRVLNVCARGEDLKTARERAYEAIARIDWPQAAYRKDIGWRGLAAAEVAVSNR